MKRKFAAIEVRNTSLGPGFKPLSWKGHTIVNDKCVQCAVKMKME